MKNIKGTWTEKQYLDEIVKLREENKALRKVNKQLLTRIEESEYQRFYGKDNEKRW